MVSIFYSKKKIILTNTSYKSAHNMKTHISHLPRHLALSQCLGQDSEIMGHFDPLLAKTRGHLQTTWIH